MGNCHDNNYKVSGQKSSDRDRKAESKPEKSRHAGAILGLTTIDDQILTCSDDKTVAVSRWSSSREKIADYENISYLSGHSRAVNRVAACRNASGNVVCWTASRDLSIRYWDVSTNTCVRTIEKAHSLNVSAVDIARDAKTVFTGSRDYSVKGWDAETGVCKMEYSCPRNIVTVLKMEHSGESSLFQGSEDLCVRVWDTKSSSKQPSMHINAFVYFPLSLALHPNGYYMATGTKGFDSVGCEVRIWDLRRCDRAVQDLKGHQQDVVGVKYSQDGSELFSVSKEGSLIAWGRNKNNNNSNTNNSSNSSSNNNNSNSSSSSIDNGACASSGSNGSADYSKIASAISTGKQFTDLSVLPCKHDNKRNIVVSAFDGSLSYYTMGEQSDKKRNEKKTNNKNDNNNSNNNNSDKNDKNSDMSEGMELLLLQATAAYNSTDEETN